MLPEAPKTLKATLSQVNPYFQEHILENLEDEIRRRRNHPRNYNLPAGLSIDGKKTTLLNDLKLTHSPNFVKRTFDLHMEQLHINVAFEVEKLMLEGKYLVFDNGDIGESGNIIFLLDDIIIEGLMPIQVAEDSFIVNKHFMLSFKPAQITTKKSSKINGKVETSESVEADKDQTLLKSCWYGLLDTIFYILYEEICEQMVEYSVTELFADEPEEMIHLSNEWVALANKLCDMIVTKAKANKSQDNIEVPDFNLTFNKSNSKNPYEVSFKKGKLSNFLNIRRLNDFALNEESDKVLYLSGGFEIRELSFSYDDCLAKHEKVESRGSCKLLLYRTKIIFRASIQKIGESRVTKLESVDFPWVRDVDYDVTNLECLSDTQDNVKSYLLSYFEGEIASKLTEYLHERFGEVIKDLDLGNAMLQ